MTWLAVLRTFLGTAFGYLVSFLREKRAKETGRQEGRQEARTETLEAVIESKDARDEINNEVAADPDLVARAARAGLVRGVKPGSRSKP